MDYQSGKIHNSLTSEMAFQLNFNFTMPICIKRFHETNLVNDDCQSLNLNGGSVIVIRWFRPISQYNDGKIYAYLEKIIYTDNEEIIHSESTLSKDFIEINIGRLFTDVTINYNRDKKINQVIKK